MKWFTGPGPRTGAIFMLLILVAAPAFAQRGGFSLDRMRERQENQIKEMVTKLTLSEGQTTAFTEIMEGALAKRVELFESARTGGDRSKMRTKVDAISKETTEALKKVLNDHQMTLYGQYQEKNSRRGRRRQN